MSRLLDSAGQPTDVAVLLFVVACAGIIYFGVTGWLAWRSGNRRKAKAEAEAMDRAAFFGALLDDMRRIEMRAFSCTKCEVDGDKVIPCERCEVAYMTMFGAPHPS